MSLLAERSNRFESAPARDDVIPAVAVCGDDEILHEPVSEDGRFRSESPFILSVRRAFRGDRSSFSISMSFVSVVCLDSMFLHAVRAKASPPSLNQC